jgi:hypothetical protein
MNKARRPNRVSENRSMQPDSRHSTNHEPEHGLPSVVPPSGRHIAQLFLVPGAIVTVGVFILLGLRWLVSDSAEPQQLLGRLESSNADVRWRAANELAQRLKRDDRLASDPKVAIQLATLLQKSLDSFARAERDLADRTGKLTDAERAKERKALQERRNDVEFLCPCLGELAIPTGVPLLTELAKHGKGADAKSVALLRRKAVWTLANLGVNLQRYDKLSPERREAVVAELQEEAEQGIGDRARWAEFSLDYLQGRQKKLGVVAALAECAKADDPFLRELVAHALTFWEGDAEEKALGEQTLLALSYDDGHGTRIEIGETD